MPDIPVREQPPRWANALIFVLAELIAITLLFVADAKGLVPLSKTPFLFAVGWMSLRLRRSSWRTVGFAWPASWPRAVAIGVAGGALMVLLELFVTHRLLSAWLGPPDLSDFSNVTGNVGNFMLLLAVVWLLAAVGEELVYRGYLMNRAAGLIGANWVLSAVLVSVVFGFSHLDQGLTGMLENTLNGVILAIPYLVSGRNLVAPILAHGVQDTIDVLLIYLGRYPGM